MLERPPLSLYVHLPWCIRKCPYCDFNSHQLGDGLPEAEYVAAVCEDMEQEALNLSDSSSPELESVFIGGGTPSLFSANAIDTLLSRAEKLFGFKPEIEITLEANPGTAEAERFRDYKTPV